MRRLLPLLRLLRRGRPLAFVGLWSLACEASGGAAGGPPAAAPTQPGYGYPAGGGGYAGAQPYPAQPYPAQPYPAQPYPAQPYPAQPYPTPGPPPSGAPATAGADPIDVVDVQWLRARARTLLAELVAALPPAARARVAQIPLATDDTVGEVNAFAACAGNQAVMVVTDDLLRIAAELSRARACDDVFGTRKVDEYVGKLAREQQPGAPPVPPPAAFYSPSQLGDPRRVARQHDVFDELTAFVLGHELAHHHLGHLPCTGGAGPFGMGDLARGLSSAVPLFNQPNELAADAAGTQNLLAAFSRRGAPAPEEGALLLMRFFAAIDQLSAVDVLFAFERTHPPTIVRVPVIQQSANLFRLSGGAYLPIPGF